MSTKLLSRLLGCLCIVGTGIIINPTSAQSFMSPPDFRAGAVMARSIVLDNNGQPILVEYKEDGTESKVITNLGDYADRVRSLVIINAADYHMEKKRLDDYKDRYKDGLAIDAEVMSREDFQGKTYVMADGTTQMAAPAVPEYVKSVLVRGRSNRILNEPKQLVLLSFAVDLSESANVPEKGTVVLTPEGKVLTSSPLLIGPRVAFYGDPQKNNNNAANPRKHDDKIFGPVKNVKVYMAESVFRGATDYTDKDGKYSFRFNLPSCPGFSYLRTAPVYADLRYANFSPLGTSEQTYPLIQPSIISCYGSHALLAFSGNLVGLSAYIGIEGNAALKSDYSDKQIDLFADVMFLSGRVVIKNPDGSPVAIGGQTEYQVKSPTADKITQSNYDFDGDGKKDTTALGVVEDQTQEDGSVKKVFRSQVNGPMQAVYFSSNPEPSGQPDAIRLADTKKELANNGLLKSISKTDFQNTDVLIFRESTGQLYMQRKGLPDDEMKYEGAADENEGGQTGLGKDGKYFYYRLIVRGVMDMEIDFSGPEPKGGWNDWSTSYELEESFREHESNHLRSGEWVRIVVINRATGYMGTRRLQLNEASQNNQGMMSLPVEEIVLKPPHLKIWAERQFNIDHGAKQGTTQTNIVGAEGAALNDDEIVTVFTEWFDEEGRPLPEELGKDNGEELGLTGRLARVVSEGQISAVAQGNLAEFPIAPGVNTQVLQVRSNLSAAEHFYIHVSGTAKDESPTFDAGNSAAGLGGRPRMLTPFLTPVYNEDKDWESFSAWGKIKGTANTNAGTALKPKAYYDWFYRPEYQFSQFGLEMDHIKRHFTDDDGNAKDLDILTSGAPSVSGDDDYLNIFYSLIDATNKRLEAIDGPQDLVLAFGAEEVKLTLGRDKTIRFDNIAQFGLLQSEDFLSLRLYLNNDAGNILWEFAFGSGLKVISSGDAGSRDAKSFIMRAAEDPIKVEWLPALEVGDRVQWKVEALQGNLDADDLGSLTNNNNKKYMYGKVKDKKFQEETVSGTGSGKYEDAWTSNAVTVTTDLEKYKQISFKPDMSDEPHPTYGSGGEYKGTKKKDVWRRNPRVGYKVTFKLNGEDKATAIVRMDEIDQLRQEYVDLKTSAPDDKGTGFILPPDRNKFKLRSEMPAGEWVDADYAYTLLLDDTMRTLYDEVTTSFATYRLSTYVGIPRKVEKEIDGKTVIVDEEVLVTIPSNLTLDLSSSYRHPERNERVNGASRSAHMFGRAIDFRFTPVNKTENGMVASAKAFYGVWLNSRAGSSPTADMYQLETGPNEMLIRWTVGKTNQPEIASGVNMTTDADRDGVPDAVKRVNHFHLQDNM